MAYYDIVPVSRAIEPVAILGRRITDSTKSFPNASKVLDVRRHMRNAGRVVYNAHCELAFSLQQYAQLLQHLIFGHRNISVIQYLLRTIEKSLIDYRLDNRLAS